MSSSHTFLRRKSRLSFLAEGILFGSFAAPLASLAGSAVQSGGSAVIFLALAAALDRVHMKNRTRQLLGV